MLELAGFAAGVCGILFLLQSGQGLSYPVLLIDLAVAAFCIFLWWIHCFSVRVGFWFDWIFGASWLLILFLFQDTLLPGMVQLMAVFLIFVLEFRWRSHGFLYLFTTLLLLAGPLVQIQPGAGSVILLLFFQIFFLSIQGRKWKKRRVTESKGTGRAETHLRITALAFIAVAFTLAAAFVLIGEEQYLKGFEGGEYENGQWMPAGEEDVLEQTSQILGWGDWRGTVGTMLDSMYFFMNSSTNPEASEEGRNLTFRYLTRDYSVYYNPYYSVWNRGYFGKSAYRYRYYEQQEMNLNWQSASREMGEYARWQRQLQNAYQKAIQKEYTKVDREALPKLSRLCRQQEGSGQEAVTRIILRTLHERASYTQTPGRAPYNQDIVEYFLFENQKGYCVHFASAAVLMYRMYGIPSRYVSGYAISPAEFEQQEDGSYVAVISDQNAHAWPEIFIEDQGWTPVEVTPSDGEAEPAEDTGEEQNTSNREEAKQESEQSLPNETEDGKQKDETGKSEEQGLAKEEDWFSFSAGWTAAGVLFFIAAGILVRRQVKLRRMKKADCRRCFSKLITAVHAAGVLREYSGQEIDFAERLVQAVQGLSREESRKLVGIVNQAAFGAEPPSEEDEAFVKQAYRKIVQRIYRNLSWYRKLQFRLFYVFL